MITDATYYEDGELYIPNIKDLPSTNNNIPNNRKKLQAAIDKYERELLVNALGFENYTELATQFEGVELKADALDKWQNLVNGNTYEIKGVNHRWDGLRNKDLKKSLVAYYVYHNYLYEDAQHYTGVGMQRENAKGSTSVDPMPKLVDVWRKFIKEYQQCDVTFPSIITTKYGRGIDWYGVNNEGFISLYQYLCDNEDTYGELRFKFYDNRNQLGI